MVVSVADLNFYVEGMGLAVYWGQDLGDHFNLSSHSILHKGKKDQLFTQRITVGWRSLKFFQITSNISLESPLGDTTGQCLSPRSSESSRFLIHPSLVLQLPFYFWRPPFNNTNTLFGLTSPELVYITCTTEGWWGMGTDPGPRWDEGIFKASFNAVVLR